MRTVVGVAVHAEPERLRATLESLERFTPAGLEVLLLADHPDQLTSTALSSLSHLPRAAPETPGMAACFNVLARQSDAELIVLLESGSIVGPGWLERLAEALAAHPSHGLAGPSTNSAWNEQRVFPAATGTLDDVARRAAEARQRYGSLWRTLAPLHSLADFCYAVRREVILAIGDADEAYGTGPCWEMDYNIRAWRAGFAGVWAMSSYVYRHPFTARRVRDEARYFPASRMRYQDKFCALRLRQERTSYEPTCRGGACEHFAPVELIQLRLPAPAPAAAPAVGPDAPLVTCVMPTRGRVEFVRQSVTYFLRQTVTASELVVLDDGPEDLQGALPRDPRVRYVRLASGESIGAKRNRGVELARGRFIAHWDDDDWYAPTRLEAQLRPLLEGAADMSGLTGVPFFDLAAWEFWQVTPGLHRRLFVQDVHGGTLMYERRIWDQGCRYPSLNLAEDAHFLAQAVRRGARLARVPGESECLYVRHAQNSWRFSCGRFLDPKGWVRVPEAPLPAGDREFYRARSPAAPGPDAALPLVSCIMPTADRRPFVCRALEYFGRQDYPAAELIVLDDGDGSVADLIPADPRIRYERLPSRTILGTKRNLACEMARGDLILHWDDDDWCAPNRISRQASALVAAPNVEVCGLADLFFYDVLVRQAWRYRYHLGGRPWVAGNTMCYRRRVWKRAPFAAVGEGEDTRFVWSLEPRQVSALADPTFFVGILHGRNTGSRRRRDSAWSMVEADRVRRLMGDDANRYDALSAERQLSRSSQPQT